MAPPIHQVTRPKAPPKRIFYNPETLRDMAQWGKRLFRRPRPAPPPPPDNASLVRTSHELRGYNITLLTEGERIIDDTVTIGRTHRGWERQAEALTWDQILPHAAGLNPSWGVIPAVAYALAVERLVGVAIPPRGQAGRMVLCELARMASHLDAIASVAWRCGAEEEAVLGCLEARDIVGKLLGQAGQVCLGGMEQDLPLGLEGRVSRALGKVERLRARAARLLEGHRGFIRGLRGSGIMSITRALALGITGPVLRASGLPHDTRCSCPYLLYDRIDLTIPVGERGDNLDRYLVRLAEVQQSASLLHLLLEGLPEGPMRVEVGRVPAGEVYVPVESPDGELGFYLVSDGSPCPVRVRCRTPGFINMQALEGLLVGGEEGDLVPTLELLNPLAMEVDR